MSTPPWGQDPGNQGNQGNPADPQPYGQQAYQPYGAPPPAPGGYGYAPVKPTNGMAIASLVVSIVGFFACCGAPSIIGAILGHVAQRQIKRDGGQGQGIALAGIIVGWIAFAVFVVFAAIYGVVIIAAITSDGTY